MAANQRGNTRARKTAAQAKRHAHSSNEMTSSPERSIDTMRDEIAGYVSRGATQIREMTREHEGTTVLLALGAGFGLGLLIGGLLASSRSRPRSWSDRLAAEGIGRRLLERLERVLPDALDERIGR